MLITLFLLIVFNNQFTTTFNLKYSSNPNSEKNNFDASREYNISYCHKNYSRPKNFNNIESLFKVKMPEYQENEDSLSVCFCPEALLFGHQKFLDYKNSLFCHLIIENFRDPPIIGEMISNISKVLNYNNKCDNFIQDYKLNLFKILSFNREKFIEIENKKYWKNKHFSSTTINPKIALKFSKNKDTHIIIFKNFDNKGKLLGNCSSEKLKYQEFIIDYLQCWKVLKIIKSKRFIKNYMKRQLIEYYDNINSMESSFFIDYKIEEDKISFISEIQIEDYYEAIIVLSSYECNSQNDNDVFEF